LTRVLEETTSQDLDRDHITRRVDDWAKRIDSLYWQVAGWLPAGWTADRQGRVEMHEKLMQRFAVPARQLPVLQLWYQDHPAARIEPRGLWIIGTNGRLDFFTRSGQYIIIDSADNFASPDWRIAPLSDRRTQKPLDQETLTSAL
jgi:hypothetical protein